MSYILKNHNYIYLIWAVVLAVGAQLCSISVEWSIAYCFVAPTAIGLILRKYLNDHDFDEELIQNYVDAEWESVDP